MNVELWRPVPWTGGLYEASDQGRIRSNYSRPPRVLVANVNHHGYAHVTVCVGGRKLNRRVHQLVTAAFLGECPPRQEVRHLDGDKLNNVLTNLAYGTPSENAQDVLEHGTHWQLKKTHCPKGHAYDAANTRVDVARNGAVSRICRACHSASVTAANAARRAARRIRAAA